MSTREGKICQEWLVHLFALHGERPDVRYFDGSYARPGAVTPAHAGMMGEMATAFTTLAAPAQAEIEVKRSRFVCTVQRVDGEGAARDVIDATRKAHWGAGHHCSAMILGPDRSVERSSDDGEPAGTAGAPMLEILRGRELSDVVAVVSRWFGGTKLGTGGLARAYGDAVRAALESAATVRCALLEEFVVEVDHATAGRLENDLRLRGVEILTTAYGERARIRLGIPAGRRGKLEATLAELTSGLVDLEAAGTSWRDAPA